MSYHDEDESTRKQKGWSDGTLGVYNHSRLSNDQAYASAYYEAAAAAERELRRYEASSPSVKLPNEWWAYGLVFFGICLLAPTIAEFAREVFAVLRHVAEPVMVLVWRPLYALDLIPTNYAVYFWSNVFSILVICGTFALIFYNRISDWRRLIPFFALTIIVLEALRFSACIGVDAAIAQLYSGTGLCKHGLWHWSFAFAQGLRWELGDNSLALFAIAVVQYVILTTLAMAIVLLPVLRKICQLIRRNQES